MFKNFLIFSSLLSNYNFFTMQFKVIKNKFIPFDLELCQRIRMRKKCDNTSITSAKTYERDKLEVPVKKMYLQVLLIMPK
jgi:hypothetical protein